MRSRRKSPAPNNEMVAEEHYISVDQVTPFHKEKIKELRQEVSDILATYPEYDTDFSLLRWLMGWDYNIKTIAPRLRAAITMLKNLDMDQEQAIDSHQINSRIRSMSQAAEYFPGGLMGQDDEGNVVYVEALARTHPKTLAKSGCVSELLRLSLVETELAFKLLRKTEAKCGKKLGLKILIDLDGFSMDLLYTPTLKIYMGLLSLMQDTFPDFARKIYIVNTPMMMQTVYAMISPVLSKQTKEKVQFLGSNWKEVIAQDIGVHNIYRHWGGSKAHAKDTGDLRMGGKVPEKLWYDPDNSVEESDKSSLTKLSVGARTRGEVTIDCDKGNTLRWWWRVSSGDVDFSIEKDGTEVYPKFRLSTEFHPEIGSMICKEAGTYTLYFDNSHGKIFGKDVKYKLSLQ